MFNSSNSEILNIHSPPRDIEDYLERFELWCLTKGDLKDDIKVAHFLTIVGKDAYSLIKNLSFPNAPSKLSYEKIKEILLHQVMPRNFEIAERAKFNVMQRHSTQAIRDFILQLQTQATRCSFGDKLDEHLRDRLIAGIQIPELYRQLLMIQNPTYENIKIVCEQYQDVTDIVKTTDTIPPDNSDNQVLFNFINHNRNNTRPSYNKQRHYNSAKQFPKSQNSRLEEQNSG